SVSLSSDRQLTAPEVAAAPWPGRLPAPAPAVVYGERERIEVIDAAGNPVVVNGRGEVVSEPVHVVRSGRRRTVAAWAGPWPIEERWWDAAGRRRQARFQVVFDDDTAHLVVVEGGTWWLEASYD
ncbi:MAG: DNA polymerase Y family protein, partial [Actinomycetota bacterium]|nr:DNA polymerase Y family protein [Actinomycetota bacterium]